MVDLIKLWFHVAYEVMKHGVEGLSLLVHRLHEDARKHEDPKSGDYDPEHAAQLREQARKFAEAKQEIKRATDAGLKNQPGDRGEEK